LIDSTYVVVLLKVLTRIGNAALAMSCKDCFFVKRRHSVDMPLADSAVDVVRPCNDEKLIVHYPETRGN
jgi:phosphoenolpyruvate carboxykinase (GTP)